MVTKLCSFVFFNKNDQEDKSGCVRYCFVVVVVFVCVCVCACVRACVRVCVCMNMLVFVVVVCTLF